MIHMPFPLKIRGLKKTRNPTTDRRTDRPSYRDAWTHLKTVSLTLFSSQGTVYHVYLGFFKDFITFPLKIRCLKKTRYRPMDGPTDRPTDGQTLIYAWTLFP